MLGATLTNSDTFAQAPDGAAPQKFCPGPVSFGSIDEARKLVVGAFIERLRDLGAIGGHSFQLASLLLLKYHNSGSGRCNPSHASLADDLGCSISTVKRALDHLKNLGVLGWSSDYVQRDVGGVRRPRRTPNSYGFFVPASVDGARRIAKKVASAFVGPAYKMRRIAGAIARALEATTSYRVFTPWKRRPHVPQNSPVVQSRDCVLRDDLASGCGDVALARLHADGSDLGGGVAAPLNPISRGLERSIARLKASMFREKTVSS